MSLLDSIALIFGVLGVLLTIKQSIWCWPSALISVLASFAEFYNQRLYGDMLLQVFYFFSGIYGWYFWEKNKNATFTVQKINLKTIPLLLLVSAVLAIILFFILNYFKGDKVILDSILTALSLTATYMMTKKWIENWIAWVVIDFTYIILYTSKSMWLFAVLYFIFTLMAAYGFFRWKKLLKK
jgi:nicotinamide mononucleotide transporter